MQSLKLMVLYQWLDILPRVERVDRKPSSKMFFLKVLIIIIGNYFEQHPSGFLALLRNQLYKKRKYGKYNTSVINNNEKWQLCKLKKFAPFASNIWLAPIILMFFHSVFVLSFVRDLEEVSIPFSTLLSISAKLR